MRQQLGRVVAVVACALVVTLIMLGVPEAFAQQRGQPSFGGGYGDMNSLAAGFRFILRIAVIAVPILLMAYYTWKMRPKDLYEVAWVVLAWCGIAYILGIT